MIAPVRPTTIPRAPSTPASQTRPSQGFAVDARGQGAPAADGAAAATSGVSAATLIGLQEAGERPARERQEAARRRARAMLTQLGAIQCALLAGAEDASALGMLRHLLATHDADGAAYDDPALAALAGEVALRARIELARRQR